LVFLVPNNVKGLVMREEEPGVRVWWKMVVAKKNGVVTT